MSELRIYPKTWALYQQGRLNIAEQHGMLLLNDKYIFDENHKDYGDIPIDAIISEASLSTIQYEGANNRFTVPDGQFRKVLEGETVHSVILYRQDEYEDDSRLVYYSEDLDISMITTGVDITISFPEGVLVVASSGYTTPSIIIVEEVGMSTFDVQINSDISNVLMNPDEFGVSVTYTHTNNVQKQYMVLKTATPDETDMLDVDMNSITQTIKIQNSSTYYPPRRGDKVLMEGVMYNVAGASAENYTTDLFLQTTILGG